MRTLLDHWIASDIHTHNGIDYLGTVVGGQQVADNLLECVGSYVHGVASLNAANVWSLRTAAHLLGQRGDDGAARELHRVAGGARKAPPQLPYITEWACSSIGANASVVIESLFGVRVDPAGRIRAGGPIADLDPDARPTSLRVGDNSWTITARGTATMDPVVGH